MKVDELIKELETVREEHGNLELEGWDLVIEENDIRKGKIRPGKETMKVKTITLEYEPVFIRLD